MDKGKGLRKEDDFLSLISLDKKVKLKMNFHEELL